MPCFHFGACQYAALTAIGLAAFPRQSTTCIVESQTEEQVWQAALST